MRPIRTAAVFAALMLASAVLAPSVGAFNERVNTGTTGFYTIPDDASSPGAVCRYENNPGTLNDETNRSSSRKMWTHGPWAQTSWIGYRTIVMKRKTSLQPWNVAWRSPINKKQANNSEVAFFGAKRYLTPEAHNKQYRVVVQLTYYQKGSKTKVAGKVRGAVEVHKHAMTGKAPYLKGQEGGPMGWCQKRFQSAP